MLKKSLIIGMVYISFFGMSQTQCNGITKSNIQCKNTTKDSSGLCYTHDPNYVKKSDSKAVICSGTTKQNQPCKRKTKDISGKCHNHRD